MYTLYKKGIWAIVNIIIIIIVVVLSTVNVLFLDFLSDLSGCLGQIINGRILI